MLPSLPQPVVKVPTELLACGLESVLSTAAALPSSSSGPRHDPFTPPEAYLSSIAGGARHDTPAGDVWACGVLLLKLLGGRLKASAYSHSRSGAAKAAASDLFDLPAQPGSKAFDQGLQELLTSMLQARVVNRITLSLLLQCPAFQ